MKLVAVASGVVVLAFPSFAPSDALTFAPKSGTVLKKTLTETSTWELRSMEGLVDGTPVAMDAPELSGVVRRRLVVLDSYVKLEGGVPLELKREFDVVEGGADLEINIEGQTADSSVELRSEIDDALVVFERKSKDAEPTVKRAGAEVGADRVLAGLREDLDLRAWITEEGVEEGDWWKIDVATLRDVLTPGGDLLLTPRSVRATSDGSLNVASIIGTGLCSVADNAREWTGEVICTWRETRKNGEARIAVIELDWDSTGTSNLDDELARRREAVDDDGSTVTMATTWTSKGRGELRWNLGAARAESFELRLESTVQVDWTEGEPAPDLRFGLKVESELRATFEVP